MTACSGNAPAHSQAVQDCFYRQYFYQQRFYQCFYQCFYQSLRGVHGSRLVDGLAAAALLPAASGCIGHGSRRSS